MTMRALPHLCALILGVGAALLTGCGDRSKLIPAGDAGEVKASLTQVRQAVASGNCGSADKAIAQAQSAVENLPPSVDPRVKSRLRGGIDRLATRSDKECAANESATTQETIPTTEEVVPEETTSTEEPPAEPETPSTDTSATEPPITPGDPDAGGGASPTTETPPDGTFTPDPGGATPDPGTSTDPGVP